MNKKLTNDKTNALDNAADEEILFQSGDYNSEAEEDLVLGDLLKQISSHYTPSVLLGSLGFWDGRTEGYKYCHEFKDFKYTLGNYDGYIFRRIGTRLYVTLIHHDGHHEMELRRLTDYGIENMYSDYVAYFTDKALEFFKRNTEDFGKITKL